jgi:RAD51-like protein 1
VLSLPEVELMALLDAGILTARAAVSRVSEFTCPPCHTVPPPPPRPSRRFCRFGLTYLDRFAQALALLEERVRLGGGGRLATTLCGLDEALGGGLPLGKLTEVVGPSGIGKTQVSRCA